MPAKQYTPCFLGLFLALLGIPGCNKAPTTSEPVVVENQHTEVSTNRIAIPASVRDNLGITFVPVERRRIEQTLRVPGRFEYLPSARRAYRTMLPGQVVLLVDQFDTVTAGTPLYRIDSPAWREIQKEIAQAQSNIKQHEATLRAFGPLQAAHVRHEETLFTSVANRIERLAQLQAIREAGGGRAADLASARASLAAAEADLAEVQERKAELEGQRATTSAKFEAAGERYELLLDSTAALLDTSSASLREEITFNGTTAPRWRTISDIEVVSTGDGVVESINLTDGAWADQRAAVLHVVQPERLRFHAEGLQSDLGVLRDGLEGRIVPPTPSAAGRGIPLQETMSGTLALGLSGNPDDRTFDLYLVPDELRSWARPGVSAQLEIVTDATASPELAIPLAAVQWDGLTPVLFRRAPDDPNQAIRLEADLGSDDGRWVAVFSGLRDGDEVVLDGGFQLMLATSGSIQKGGHFHSDGTFHEGDD